MTHKELIKKAKQWLLKKENCKVILAEKSNGAEIPDILSYKTSRYSILIECKTSLADFRADAKKWFRQDGYGMGQQRYFFAPKGVIPKEELPPNWGLLEIENNTITTSVKHDLVYMDEQVCWAEMPLLVSVVRKLQYQNTKLKKKLRSTIR